MMRGILLLSAALVLAGCTGRSSNVSGEFACRAPGGTCAPLRSIDEMAVREAGGTPANAASLDPAGHAHGKVSILAAYGDVAPERTGERVLRIVFPARVDAQGIYHEPSAVHAVVESPRWAEGDLSGARGEMAKMRAGEEGRSAQAAATVPGSLDDVVEARAAKFGKEARAYRSFPAQTSGQAALPPALSAVASPAEVAIAPPVAPVPLEVASAPVPAAAAPVVQVTPIRRPLPKASGETTAQLNESILRKVVAQDHEVAKVAPPPVVQSSGKPSDDGRGEGDQ